MPDKLQSYKIRILHALPGVSFVTWNNEQEPELYLSQPEVLEAQFEAALHQLLKGVIIERYQYGRVVEYYWKISLEKV